MPYPADREERQIGRIELIQRVLEYRKRIYLSYFKLLDSGRIAVELGKLQRKHHRIDLDVRNAPERMRSVRARGKAGIQGGNGFAKFRIIFNDPDGMVFIVRHRGGIDKQFVIGKHIQDGIKCMNVIDGRYKAIPQVGSI